MNSPSFWNIIGKRNLWRSYVFIWNHLGICIPITSIAIANGNVRLRSSTWRVKEEKISRSWFRWILIIRYGRRIYIRRDRIKVVVVWLDIIGRLNLAAMCRTDSLFGLLVLWKSWLLQISNGIVQVMWILFVVVVVLWIWSLRKDWRILMRGVADCWLGWLLLNNCA